MEITRETMGAIAQSTATTFSRPLLAWQVQDRLNATDTVQASGAASTLPKMNEVCVLPANDVQRAAGMSCVVLRKVSARYWLRVALA